MMLMGFGERHRIVQVFGWPARKYRRPSGGGGKRAAQSSMSNAAMFFRRRLGTGRGRRGGRGKGWILGDFYLNPTAQFVTTLVSAVVLTGFVFSGFLLFRYTDAQDLLMRGKRYLAQGKVAWAVNTFQTLVHQYPKHFEGYLLLGQAYLDQGYPDKAVAAFRKASRLRPSGDEDASAFLAMSKLAMAQGNFEMAEAALLKAYGLSGQSDATRQALLDLYSRWGDRSVMEALELLNRPDAEDEGEEIDRKKQRIHVDLRKLTDATPAELLHPAKAVTAIRYYGHALRYVNRYSQQEALVDKLVATQLLYASWLEDKKKPMKAITMLRESLKHRRLPETMARIAELYAANGKPNSAIEWYRKAHDVSPNTIGARLSQLLMKRANELAMAGKKQEAEALMAEARKASRDANLPMDELYPIGTDGVSFTFHEDWAKRTIAPHLKITFENQGDHMLGSLQAKARFIQNGQVLGEVVETVATPRRMLAPKGKPGSQQTIVFRTLNPLRFDLDDGKLVVKLLLAYGEANSDWQTKRVLDYTLESPVKPKPDVVPEPDDTAEDELEAPTPVE